MKLIQISAPSSESGKTITTTILARTLKNLGHDITGFKCGPDYVDSKYLSFACKRDNGNLDIHLMGKDALKKALALNKSDLGIVEGAMGYFDGIGLGYEASAYDIAKSLDINTILVYQPKGEMFTIIPKIKGMVDMSEGRIKGLIFSNTTKMMYSYLKKMMESNLDIKVLGFIERSEDLKLGSRQLGLMLPEELEELDEVIENASLRSMETIDYQGILALTKPVSLEEYYIEDKVEKPSIAVAKDQAFCFHYGENDKLFEKYFNVYYFSPLKDKNLPEVDLVYMGGGYPELFIEELSNNKEMLCSIKNHIESGKYYIGEGAGLIYLGESFEEKKLAGILPIKVKMNKSLQNFGYVNLILEKDNILGKTGDKIPAHEFHYSSIEGDIEGTIRVEKASKFKEWVSGYEYKNALGIYQHINFCGNEKVLDHIIKILGGKNVSK